MVSQTHNNISTLRPIIKRLDAVCSKYLSEAAELAYSMHHEQLSLYHFLLVLLQNPVAESTNLFGLNSEEQEYLSGKIKTILKSMSSISGITPFFSEKLVELLKNSFVLASLASSGNPIINIDMIVTNILKDDELKVFLRKSCPDILAKINSISESDISLGSTNFSNYSEPSQLHDLPFLARFTDDLSSKAKEGKIEPVVGRYHEVEQVVECLIRRRQNNPILVGEAGVGKTAIVEALSLKIAAGNVPEMLRDVSIRVLDIGGLKAGASQKGELESRLKSIMLEITTCPQPIVLFVDEIHAFMGSASTSDNMDIANLIKPELSRGKFRIIGATTWAEYKKFIEKDPALTRRFQLIKVNEASEEDTLDILTSISETLEQHHSVKITYQAMRSAIECSVRYLPSRQLPDKAISLLDTACARRNSERSSRLTKINHLNEQRKLIEKRCENISKDIDLGLKHFENDLLQNKSQIIKINDELKGLEIKEHEESILVNQSDIASIICSWTGVPIEQINSGQSDRIRLLETQLKDRIIGQVEQIEVIVNKIRTYSAGIADAEKPIGVFMLTGPTGVGKTETAHAIAELFFGKDSITSINMSEYQEAHTVSKLKGAPAGYVGYGQGGVLTEAIRRRPYGLLLLDEFEKAHPDVQNLFLQIFDKGFIEDSEGVFIDFTSTLILLTSNAGFDIGLYDRSKDSLNRSLKSLDLDTCFSQALLGRVEVVQFRTLDLDELMLLATMKLNKLAERFNNVHKRNLVIGERISRFIAEMAYNSPEGGRIVQRLITQNIEKKISEMILSIMDSDDSMSNIEVEYDGSDILVKTC